MRDDGGSRNGWGGCAAAWASTGPWTWELGDAARDLAQRYGA